MQNGQRTNERIDWVLLGTHGWQLYPGGAALMHPFGDPLWGDPTICCRADCAHLDRRSGRLMLGGCAQFVRRVLRDIQQARPA